MEELNLYLFDLIHGLAGKNFALDDFGIFIAQYLPYLLMIGFFLFAFGKKDWRLRILISIDAALAVILSRGIVAEAIRFFYHHPRPFVTLNFAPLISESSYSFPSGHASWFFALAATIYAYDRKLGAWFFVFAAINGIARVFAGVHWPFDILSGAVVGILSGIIMHRLVKPTAEKLSVANR